MRCMWECKNWLTTLAALTNTQVADGEKYQIANQFLVHTCTLCSKHPRYESGACCPWLSTGLDHTIPFIVFVCVWLILLHILEGLKNNCIEILCAFAWFCHLKYLFSIKISLLLLPVTIMLSVSMHSKSNRHLGIVSSWLRSVNFNMASANYWNQAPGDCFSPKAAFSTYIFY